MSGRSHVLFFYICIKLSVLRELPTVWKWASVGMVMGLPWTTSLVEYTVPLWGIIMFLIPSAWECLWVSIVLIFWALVFHILYRLTKYRLINWRIIYLWLTRDLGVVMFLPALPENFNHRPLELERTSKNTPRSSFILQFWNWGAKIVCDLSRFTQLGSVKALHKKVFKSTILEK